MSGYIATDPQIMGKDKNAARFRIRHDRSRKVKEEWTKEASFFSVVVFGEEQAEKVSGFNKGEQVIVKGSLRQNTRGEGEEKKEYIDIIADIVALTDPNGRKHTPEPSNDEDWLS